MRDVHDEIPYYRTSTAQVAHALPFARELLLVIRLAQRILQVARIEHPHILHAHSPVLNGLAALFAGRALRLPVVYEVRALWEDAATDHGTYTRRSLRYHLVRSLEGRVMRRASAVVTLCHGLRADLVSRRGIPAGRVHIVPNGVDPDMFAPFPGPTVTAPMFGLGPGPVLGFVGSFYRYEGLRFLLEATPSLLQVIPTAQVLLVGGGPDEPALRQLARPLGSSVILPGYLPHARLRAAYAAMDIFVCPRLRSRLTELVTPLKPLEAMSMARPLLASDVGGLAELLQPDVTGVLFRADDPEALLRETLRLARDRTLREKLGANARADVVARRSWGHVVPRYLPVYSAAQCPH